MCLFTHFAAGALAGGATGHWGWAIPAGLASHAVLDAIPHYDHPDWRVELAGGLAALVLLLLMPFASPAAVVGGLMGMAPDLENLFQKLGRLDRKRFIFPSHTGLVPHGRELGPRTLVWQAVIFAGCFVALDLATPSPAGATTGAEMDRPVVHLVSSSRDFTVLRVDFPVATAPGDWATLEADAIGWALPATLTEPTPGVVRKLPPRLTVQVAMPGTDEPVTSLQSLSWWREPEHEVQPGDLVRFEAPAVYRSVPLTGAEIPLGVDGGVLRSLTVRIDHPAGPDWRALEQLARTAPARTTAGVAAPMPSTVANAGLFDELGRIAADAARARAAQKSESADDLFGLTSHWVRIEISQSGLYSLDGQDLVAAGLNSTSAHPASLRLYRGGGLPLAADPTVPDADQLERAGLNEVAIEVFGAADGEWNLDDELRFYGVATSDWLDRFEPDADPLEHFDHPQAARAVYWLTWEATGTSPLPGTPARTVAQAATPTGGQALTMVRLRSHHEKQQLPDTGRVADNFVWYQGIDSAEEYFTLPGAVADSLAFFVLDWRIVCGDVLHLYDSAGATAYANNSPGTQVTAWLTSRAQDDSLRVRLAGPFPPVVGAANSIHLLNAATWSGRRLLCWDSYDILYWSQLDLRSHTGQLDLPVWDEQTDAAAADLVIIPPSGQTPLLWDVTDPAAPHSYTGAVTASHPGAVTFGVDLSEAVNRHYVAFTTSRLLQVAAVERVTPKRLRQEPAEADYLIVYPGVFRAAAQTLADYRAASLPGVESPTVAMVDVRDIYDNFSGGQKDWRAIRNYLRHVYQDGGQRLRYVCLLGNACRDWRNYLGRTAQVDPFYDFIPTDLRTAFPRDPDAYTADTAYASDDGFVSFDAPPASYDLDFPDAAIGRIPAISASEANAMVEKVIEYSDEPAAGTWRNRFLVVADDQKYHGTDPYSGEYQHTDMAEEIALTLLPETLDVSKIYSLAYPFTPAGALLKPEVKGVIKAAVSEGTTVYHYIGHGSQESLADERIFEVTDIGALTNGDERCVFVAFSCDVGVFDSTNRRSMGEVFLTTDQGGGIASITASQVSYIGDNNALTRAFYSELYPSRRVDETIGLGAALASSKRRMVTSGTRRNSQRYNLMGDPALVLPHPRNRLALAVDGGDTLRSGLVNTVRIDGEASEVALSAGDAYHVRVEDSAVTRTYVAYNTIRGYFDNTYVEPGAALHQGTGEATSADPEASFVVPTQIRFGDEARVRFIVEHDGVEYSGQMTLPAVRSTDLPHDDLAGPGIDLAFADGLRRVRPGATLTATLTDPSGIATVGTSPITSILLEFDDTGFMTDVTESFAYDPDSYTTGRIALALPADLDLGSHVVSLFAADALGNVGSDTLSFRIDEQILTGVDAMALFPNPTSGPCRLVFELGEAMSLRWDIYAVSGKRLRTIESDFTTAGPASMAWDGRDDQGDEIANGTYLYVLRGRSPADPDHPFHKTGKLVLMK